MLSRNEYDRFRIAPLDPAALRAGHVEQLLQRLANDAGGKLTFEKLAESIAGRSIYLARIGTGPKRVLLWSQMHGDEPTHTAVLLDLANYLLKFSTEPPAAEILANCTLYFIPLLNPDGAEAVTRFNAQGIDINRDARRLATPEGRALKKAVETLRPEFAFNLHNQHARTSVGRPPKPAAVSVLAPAPDPSDNESPSMHRAKLMCATLVEAVRPHVEGMISRYDDEHEPRAFGDTIQATGAATMLIEAGGWPAADIEPLTRVHFHGMLATLHAIANDSYLNADVAAYEQLPESNSARQLDCLITAGHVLTAVAAAPFQADLGISQTRTERLSGAARSDGKIVDIGDLSTLSAKTNIDAAAWLILPGQIALVETWSPDAQLSPAEVDQLLAQGVTTVVGCVDLARRDAIDAIAAQRALPFNWAFIGRLDRAVGVPPAELVERVATAVSRGLLAIATDRANEESWETFTNIGAPLVQWKALARTGSSYRDTVAANAKLYQVLRLPAGRGLVGRDAWADLALLDVAGKLAENDPADWKRLVRVLVAGETVWQHGKRIGGAPGIFLRRS